MLTNPTILATHLRLARRPYRYKLEPCAFIGGCQAFCWRYRLSAAYARVVIKSTIVGVRRRAGIKQARERFEAGARAGSRA